jgi:hypothetical protein
MRVVIRYYARGNVGTTEPSEELIQVGEKIKSIYESRGFDEAREKAWDILREVLFEETHGWDIKIEGNEIKISNQMLSEGASWGYESAEIFEDDTKERLEEDYKKCLDFVKKYNEFIVEVSSYDYAVGVSVDSLGIEDGDTINRDQALSLIENIFDYLNNEFDEFTPAEQSVPVNCNNPFAYDEPGWEIKIEQEKLTIKTHYQDLQGAHYHSFNEEIVITATGK